MRGVQLPDGSLWIDFKLYFYVRTHKSISTIRSKIKVVNWFQIVFLREDSQVMMLGIVSTISCELISNWIFTWGLTRCKAVLGLNIKLWIDFKLYFYVRTHKSVSFFPFPNTVVNWFQIVFLREDSQVLLNIMKHLFRCELISNCIFTWGLTRYLLKHTQKTELWIDFKLYFYVRTHK